jgi:branched-chain amino acid transport system substrate-binding protein
MSERLIRATKVAGASLLTIAVATGGVSAASSKAHPQATYTLTIGTSVPLTSGLHDLADGINKSVEVAVAQANAHHLLKNVVFKVRELDDTVGTNYSPDKDAANARTLIADSTVVGEVGPLNTGAAQASMPIYNQNGLVQVSPSNTNPGLTAAANLAQYQPATAAGKGPRTYFRTCTRDIEQGGGAAAFASKHFKSVYVTDNKDPYGTGLASYFKSGASKLGMKVLGSGELEPNQPQMGARALATVIKNTTGGNVDLVYFGGEYGTSGGAEFLAKALRQVGLAHTAIMGGDGIYDPAFIQSASPSVVNGLAYATSVGSPTFGNVSVPAAAKNFAAAFKKQFPGGHLAAYDYESYDAANVIIQAVVAAVHQGKFHLGMSSTSGVKANREAVARALAATHNFQGATGVINFDKNGDTSSKVISVYKVINGQWQFVQYAPGYGPQ